MRADLLCEGADDPGMRLVIANGYYSLRARGRLEQSVFRAVELRGGGCDSRYYAWRHGNAAVREHAPP